MYRKRLFVCVLVISRWNHGRAFSMVQRAFSTAEAESAFIITSNQHVRPLGSQLQIYFCSD